MSRKRSRPTPKRGWQPLQKAGISPEGRAAQRAAGVTLPDRAYVNDRYSVFVRSFGNDGQMHISFHRHDRAAVRDWRHFQQIKNEVAGPERVAIEIFPAESDLVDTANEYHLWVLPANSPKIGLGGDGIVMTPEELTAELGPDTKARQRAWDPGLTTGAGSR